MRILALDTTTRSGSVALLADGVLLDEREGEPTRTHGQRLPAELDATLQAARLSISDIDLFAVAAGPGSFTGLRVGIATIQGLAFTLGRQVVPVSTLDALARLGGEAGAVAAWMDAQRGEVFAALYAPGGRELLVPASSGKPDEILDRWSRNLAGCTFVGDGAIRYQDRLVSRLGPDVPVVVPAPRLAATIARMAAENPSRAVPPHAIVPIYVRRPDAELARDRGLTTTKGSPE